VVIKIKKGIYISALILRALLKMFWNVQLSSALLNRAQEEKEEDTGCTCRKTVLPYYRTATIDSSSL
jgi:hypothetical protein